MLRTLLDGVSDLAHVEEVAVERSRVRAVLRMGDLPPLILVLRHPSTLRPADHLLPSFAVAVRGAPAVTEAPDTAAVLERLHLLDAGDFPWRPAHTDAPERDARGATLEPTATRQSDAPPQARLWIPPEPPWRRRVRDAGTLAWILLYGGLALLVGLGAAWRRRDPAAAERPTSRRAHRWGLVAFVGVNAVVCAVLTELLITAWLPAPRAVRGAGPEAVRAPAPGEVGLYAWGESTMEGDVYQQVLDIPRLVAWTLEGRLGDRPLHVQNLAVSSLSLSEHRPERLYRVLSDPERFRPAAVLLYVGHNEYYNRRGALPDDPEAARRLIEDNYERSVREIARRCADAGAVLLVGLPVSNKAGAPPQRSEHGRTVPALGRMRAEALTGTAEGHLRREAWAEALADAEEAVALSPSFGRSHWLRARALRGLGREAEARRSLDRAVTLDRDRQRAMPSQNAILRRLCDDGLARCVDVQDTLRARYGALDEDLFTDLHHPVAAGHAVLAQAYADTLAEALDLPRPRRLDPDRLPPGFDVSGLALDVQLQPATWWLNQAGLPGAEGGPDPYARRDALRRVETKLDEAQRIYERTPYAEGTLGPIAYRRALVAALRGDRPETRRWLREALQEEDEDVLYSLGDPWNRAVLGLTLEPSEIPEGRTVDDLVRRR